MYKKGISVGYYIFQLTPKPKCDLLSPNYSCLIVGLIALLVLAVVIPQAILTLCESGNHERDPKIAELTKEIETLKQHIVSP